MIQNYTYKTEPFDHQRRIFPQARDRSAYGLWWQQGTGKTKEAVDECGWQFLTGQINAVLVLSPNDIRFVWEKEFPKHTSPDVPLHVKVVSTGECERKWFKEAWPEFLNDGYSLTVLSMSYDTFVTKKGFDLAAQYVKARKVAMVLDEATRIKSPTAKRTRAVLKLAPKVVTRRALTGTLIENGPFDAYSPVKFLQDDFWKHKGVGSFTAFKRRFAKWKDGFDPRSGRKFPVLVEYQNLDQLKQYLAEIGSRETKESAGLNLPPKVYASVPFEMSTYQKSVYREMEKEFLTFLQSGEMITAPLALTRLLRLQQITCGYIGGGDGGVCLPLDPLGANPRLNTLMGLIEDCAGQAIIWARFHRDLDLITQAIGEKRTLRYDGTVDKNVRRGLEDAFQRGDAQFLCANPATAGEGLTLTAAHTVYFYNNSFRLSHRTQAEDRTHRIGQEHSVLYSDIYARGTVDEKIVEALLGKQEIADFLMGDRLRAWISLDGFEDRR